MGRGVGSWGIALGILGLGLGGWLPTMWQAASNRPNIRQFLAVHFVTRQDGWALTAQGLAQSSNAGQTWRWSVRWIPALSSVTTALPPIIAQWQHTIWIPVHHRMIRVALGTRTSAWISSPVRASTIIAMQWRSPKEGWIATDPQGISAESEVVHFWHTSNGGRTWHQGTNPPDAGVKSGFTIGGAPSQLWLGSTHVFTGSPVLWHAAPSLVTRWQSAALLITTAQQAMNRESIDAPVWF